MFELFETYKNDASKIIEHLYKFSLLSTDIRRIKISPVSIEFPTFVLLIKD